MPCLDLQGPAGDHRGVRSAVLIAVPALAWATQLEVLTLPNWQRVPVGDRAMLEGGAVVARANGPASTFINPAGLADMERPTVSGSATMLEYTRTGSRTANGTAETDHAALQPNLVGVANATDPDDPGSGWGLSLASPITWNSALQVRSSSSGGTRRDDGRSSLSVLVPGFGYGFTPAGGLHAGFAIEAWVADYRFDSGTSAREGANVLTSTYTETGRQISLRLAFGAQWRGGDWSAGAMLRTPGISLADQGEISSSTTSGDASDTTITEAYDQHAGFALPLPWTATAGLAWRPACVAGLEVEGDLAFTAGGPPVDVFSSVQGTTTSVSGASSSFLLPARRMDPRWVLNPRLGASWRLPDPVLGRVLTLHLGAYMERSPVAESDVFSKLDLLGGTAGISAEKGPLRTSLGALYVTSSTLGDALGYVTAPGSGLDASLSDPNASFAIRSFILAMSSTYRF